MFSIKRRGIENNYKNTDQINIRGMERFSIEERAWITFAIATGAVFLAQLLGAIIGIYSAKRKNQKRK